MATRDHVEPVPLYLEDVFAFLTSLGRQQGHTGTMVAVSRATPAPWSRSAGPHLHHGVAPAGELEA